MPNLKQHCHPGADGNDTIKFLFIILLLVLAPAAQAQDGETPIIYARAKLVITPKPDQNGDTGDRELDYIAEVQQGVDMFPPGLIIEKQLADNEAVVFIYDKNRIADLNLRNLYVSRDILFVDERGNITEMIPHVTARSTQPINSVEKVRKVVQLAAGSIKKYNIRVGDKAEVFNQE